MKKPTTKSLQLRKEKFEKRLMKYGLDNTITNITFFDETQYDYVHPRFSPKHRGPKHRGPGANEVPDYVRPTLSHEPVKYFLYPE